LAWQNWGAHALVENLSLRFPDLLETSGLTWQSSTDAGNIHTTITQPITSIQLDMESIISASQLLSSETNVDQLIIKMMELVMLNSGAEKSVLLWRQDNDWFIQALSDVKTKKYDVLLYRLYDPSSSDIEVVSVPERVFDLCKRSKELLIVGNAQLDHRFAEDKTIEKYNIKSMTCIPIVSQQILKGMLYLENNQMEDVFSSENIELLKYLSSQFSISIENSLLYDSLNRKIQDLRKSEKRLSLIYDSIADILFYIKVEPDDRFRFLSVNDAFLTATGLTRDQIVGKRVDEVIPEPSIHLVLNNYKRAIKENRIVRWEETSVYPSGEIVGAVSIAPIMDEQGICTHLVGSVHDITESRKAEEEVRQAYDEIRVLKDQLQAESDYLRQEIKLEHNFENIIGNSPSLKYVLNRVEQIAHTDSPVLIMGETGTGKELLARAIHKLCPFYNRALVKVNCATLPRELIESELFGHEKGAFTGAVSKQIGRFELAKNSTLFLDEIGELPLELQAKLLRVLESGEFERLGSSNTIRSNARIIAATNRVLEEEVFKGNFREDLWYRLKVFPITIPPLRERPEDIPLLVNWFADQLSRKMNKNITKIPKSTMKMLQNYPWPGNVRELEHTVESALITAKGNKLNFELPKIKETKLSKFKSMEEMEREYIIKVLEAKNWKVGGENSAASILGMHVNTLRGRMEKLGIKKAKTNYK
jgi:chemotaxis protein methyltransferase CheR